MADTDRARGYHLLFAVALWACAAAAEPGVDVPGPPPTREQIEADWLTQDVVRSAVTPEDDAEGGCDGIKDGRWGFHTALQDDPWWQVDLGEAMPLDRVLVFNRCDHTAGRAALLAVLLSDDGQRFAQVYRHDGSVFLGQPDGKPLSVSLDGAKARYVRLQVPGSNVLNLDEVEVYRMGGGDNAALGRPATQSSVCEWSTRKSIGRRHAYPTMSVVERGLRLADSLRRLGAPVDSSVAVLTRVSREASRLSADATELTRRELYLRARWAVRQLALANPLLDFDDLLLVRGAPTTYSHMSDQYLGWWSQPGGGLYVLHDLKTDHARLQCLTEGLPPGSVIRPDLSYDGTKALFAWCRHYPGLTSWPDKLDKSRLPEDSFYHLFEVNIDGTGLRQLTFGKYNDFDGRYLPNGDIVFCSTRRGQSTQIGLATAAATLTDLALPECYVRCGGGPDRPVAVYTLHTMDSQGGNLRPISAFEEFEWTPSIDSEGRIIYARWDYVDRYGQNNMGLWSTQPDGTEVQALFGNYTRNPECFFEARSIPGSRKLIFTASGHHSITAGSLVLLDPAYGPDVPAALTRLTPEVPFPESEGRPTTYFANPFPFSEEHFLTAWSGRPLKFQGEVNDTAALGVYLGDAFGNLTLLYRDPALGSQYPLPIRPRPRPPVAVRQVNDDGAQARMLLLDAHEGLGGVAPGTVTRLRIVGIPVKTHPTMDYPSIGLTANDGGRFVLGTVPVEADGSAYFDVPAGVTLSVQALDADGMAVQTMRSGVYLQPGQTQTCVGCHEPRTTAPPGRAPLAARREPSRLAPGPEGSWPLDYAVLVQPVLDRLCVSCHQPGGSAPNLDLTPAKSYEAMVGHGSPSLRDVVLQRFHEQRSTAGQCEASVSPVLRLLRRGHQGVEPTADDWSRLITWMDTLGQRSGSFSPAQEVALVDLKQRLAPILEP